MTSDRRRGGGLQASAAVIRAVTATASLSTVVYLAWRLTALGGNYWLSVPLLVLEIWGLAQFGLLAMQGWSNPEPTVAPEPSEDHVEIDVIITCTFHGPDELERSLIACRSLRGFRRLVVAVRPERPDLVSVAERFNVEVVTQAGNHVDLFRYGLGLHDSPLAAWLEAGQVPMPTFLESTVGYFADPAVAVVQARRGMLNNDSLAMLRGGRDEDAFRSEVGYPAQGAHGGAPWIGGGSVVRSLAIRSIGDLDTTDQAALSRALVRLHADGWLSRYQSERQLILDTAPDSLDAYLMIRRRRAIEAMQVFATEENPLRYRGLSIRRRLHYVARAAAYLNSIRQLGLTLVLFTALLTGAMPFGGGALTWAGFWLPSLVLGVVARNLLARGTMSIGDWTRQGWRTLAGDLSALAKVTGLSRGAIAFSDEKRSGIRSLGQMQIVVTLLVALDAALIARGLTIFWPQLLPRFTSAGRVLILAITIVVVASMVDVLQVVVRRKQRRAGYRLTTRLVGSIDGVKVRIIDLSPSGLGARTRSRSGLEVGQTVEVTIGIPDASDGYDLVRGRGEVRSVTSADNRDRIGIELAELHPDSRERLIGYCAVDHHNQADGHSIIDLAPGHFDTDHSNRRATQVLSGTGVLLGLLAVFAGPAALPSAAGISTQATTCSFTSVGVPVASDAISSSYTSSWYQAGSTGNNTCYVTKTPSTVTTVASADTLPDVNATQPQATLIINPELEAATTTTTEPGTSTTTTEPATTTTAAPQTTSTADPAVDSTTTAPEAQASSTTTTTTEAQLVPQQASSSLPAAEDPEDGVASGQVGATNPGQQAASDQVTSTTEENPGLAIEPAQELLEPPTRRVALSDGVSWSATENILSALLVSLEEIEAPRSNGVVQYALRVENTADVAMAAPVVFDVELDEAADIRIESGDNWACEPRDGAVRCVNDQDFEAAAVSLIMITTTVASPIGPGRMALVFGSVLAVGFLVAVVNRRRHAQTPTPR